MHVPKGSPMLKSLETDFGETDSNESSSEPTSPLEFSYSECKSLPTELEPELECSLPSKQVASQNCEGLNLNLELVDDLIDSLGTVIAALRHIRQSGGMVTEESLDAADSLSSTPDDGFSECARSDSDLEEEDVEFSESESVSRQPDDGGCEYSDIAPYYAAQYQAVETLPHWSPFDRRIKPVLLFGNWDPLGRHQLARSSAQSENMNSRHPRRHSSTGHRRERCAPGIARGSAIRNNRKQIILDKLKKAIVQHLSSD